MSIIIKVEDIVKLYHCGSQGAVRQSLYPEGDGGGAGLQGDTQGSG